MNPHELALWLTLGALTLLATTSALLPLRGGHGQHAHAGPGTLTVDYLRSQRTFVTDDAEPDDEIIWPPGPTRHEPTREEPPPTPLERDLAALLHPPSNDYTGRHRLDEPYELYLPPQPLELDPAA